MIARFAKLIASPVEIRPHPVRAMHLHQGNDRPFHAVEASRMMVKARHVAPMIVFLVAFGCARKQAEPPMQPASYEPPPDTTAEPKGLPPGAPPDQSPTSPDTPEGAGTLQKGGPRTSWPSAGGRGGGVGGMGGMAGMEPVAGRPGVGGTNSIRIDAGR